VLGGGWGGDLDDRGLRLFQDEFFVDGADFGLFFVSLFAARAIFFGGGETNVVLELTKASGVVGVNHQGVFEALEVDGLALGVDFMFAVVLVPLGDSRIL